MVRVPEGHAQPPTETVTWDIPDGADGVTAARWLVRQRLHDHGLTDVDALNSVEVVVSELTSNAVKHTSGGATLRIALSKEQVRVEVEDHDAGDPEERQYDPNAVDGRGLLLVSALASAWGYARSETGKRIWAEIALPQGSRDTHAS
jgi:two-component sensor histidine kinase